ncbi:MAG: hypothetical protein WD768_14505 [Phycisphaeraceae bacterium]
MVVASHRRNWLNRIKQVMRSRHYSWLAEARDGEPIDRVMADVVADVMHICRRQGISFDELMQRSRSQFEVEEREATRV